MSDPQLFRMYQQAGQDGYPAEWHRAIVRDFNGKPQFYGIKDIVREQAGNRCVRCGHPYIKGMGEWSPCDPHCTHDGPLRWYEYSDANADDQAPLSLWKYLDTTLGVPAGEGIIDRGPSGEAIERYAVEAQWRILTVHHLNGVKLDCRWWNLASLCQRCHLTIQGKVKLEREFVREHSDWFKPYAAGWYAHRYLHEDLTRDQVEERLDELLQLELAQESLF